VEDDAPEPGIGILEAFGVEVNEGTAGGVAERAKASICGDFVRSAPYPVALLTPMPSFALLAGTEGVLLSEPAALLNLAVAAGGEVGVVGLKEFTGEEGMDGMGETEDAAVEECVPFVFGAAARALNAPTPAKPAKASSGSSKFLTLDGTTVRIFAGLGDR
jgi:hypothetical protein